LDPIFGIIINLNILLKNYQNQAARTNISLPKEVSAFVLKLMINRQLFLKIKFTINFFAFNKE